jgi:hypothetical protein
MKKFSFIFNLQTLIILALTLLSSWVSINYRLSSYFDFLILGLVIAFPLTFSLREAFKRRERAIQYLSYFKSCMQSVYEGFYYSKLEEEKKLQIKKTLFNISDLLMDFLIKPNGSDIELQKKVDEVMAFMETNEDALPKRLPVKLMLYYSRVRESIYFLMATKRHHTPFGVRFIVLTAIYIFAIFYPSALLNKTGFDVSSIYIFLMCITKGLVLISLRNVQVYLEDPFNQNGPDDIRLDDFRFSA